MTLLPIAGVLLLAAGLGQLWTTRNLYRLDVPWRRSAMIASAFVLYGLLAIWGTRPGGPWLRAMFIWVVAAILWGGLWQRRREQARTAR